MRPKYTAVPSTGGTVIGGIAQTPHGTWIGALSAQGRPGYRRPFPEEFSLPGHAADAVHAEHRRANRATA
ncbi:hypothetical protein ABZ234_31815 [Nocardiopsis sp. NPDC006198]|uniref:hypothetical protein n=1 Tax=Nocardiopsis sp. NPDC006198 TaxID=3154472 RepID=UPI0033BC778A